MVIIVTPRMTFEAISKKEKEKKRTEGRKEAYEGC
jgi:hypothetical protein